jgi:hypothetical protein
MSEQELAFGFQDVLISGPLWFSAKTNIMAHVLHCNYHNLFSLASQIVLDFFLYRSVIRHIMLIGLFVPPTLATSSYKEGFLLDSEHAR